MEWGVREWTTGTLIDRTKMNSGSCYYTSVFCVVFYRSSWPILHCSRFGCSSKKLLKVIVAFIQFLRSRNFSKRKVSYDILLHAGYTHRLVITYSTRDRVVTTRRAAPRHRLPAMT
ncbi:hypothetical protein EVAR_60791_1 [Eumeta japonica]|uniref:Uncharacterized protein n=1 Tax=Eumeta variegata TaxID=151549 RepID=A0A4C2A158_EUMVA|nr:hypothetical protein EVAR_60791_1 [Eumeta japonica]